MRRKNCDDITTKEKDGKHLVDPEQRANDRLGRPSVFRTYTLQSSHWDVLRISILNENHPVEKVGCLCLQSRRDELIGNKMQNILPTEAWRGGTQITPKFWILWEVFLPFVLFSKEESRGMYIRSCFK